MSNTISNARQENQQVISAVDWKSWCAARARSVQRSAAVLNAEVLPVRRDPAEGELHGEAAQAQGIAALLRRVHLRFSAQQAHAGWAAVLRHRDQRHPHAVRGRSELLSHRHPVQGAA